jgi:phage tail tube protein FII
MALGNANTSAQARGKNRGVKIQRRKEVISAKGFHAITGSIETGETSHNNTCSTSEAVNRTYYHNAGSASGYTNGTTFYTRARENDRYKLANGYYKVTHDGSTFKSIQIVSGRISSMATCR